MSSILGSGLTCLSIEEFEARVAEIQKMGGDHEWPLKKIVGALRLAFQEFRVALYPRHASAIQVFDDGRIALKVRIACAQCRREDRPSPRRTTIYISQNVDQSWTRSLLSNGDQIADLRTDEFRCGEHVASTLAVRR